MRSEDLQQHAAVRSVPVAVAALCLVQFVDVLGVTVVVTALPEMLRGVGASASSGSLVATGYAMFFGGLLMFGARAGDRYGHRRTILVSLTVFAAGAVLAALATSLVLLTAARCVQGAAAATAVPSALRLLTSIASTPAVRARAVSAWSAAGAAAGASGFVVGGVVGDLASWRWIFWAMVAVAAVLAIAVAGWVPAERSADRSRSLNLSSSALLTGAVMAVVVGTTLVADRDQRWIGAALLGAAAVLVLILCWYDPRSSAPLLPGPLLRQPRLRRGTVGSWLNTATTSSVATLLTLYVQDTLGRSSLAAAATLLPFSLAVIVGSVVASRTIGGWARERTAAIGLLAIAAPIFVLIAVPGDLLVIGICTATCGFGLGLSSVAVTSLGTEVADTDRATASGLINTSAQLGTAIGTAALLLVATATTGTPGPATAAPRIAWGIAGLVAVVGGVGFLILRASVPATRLK